jgi:hypothetical protein
MRAAQSAASGVLACLVLSGARLDPHNTHTPATPTTMPAAKSKGKKRALSAALGAETPSSKRIKSDPTSSFRKSDCCMGCTPPCAVSHVALQQSQG